MARPAAACRQGRVGRLIRPAAGLRAANGAVRRALTPAETPSSAFKSPENVTYERDWEWSVASRCTNAASTSSRRASDLGGRFDSACANLSSVSPAWCVGGVLGCAHFIMRMRFVVRVGVKFGVEGRVDYTTREMV